VGVGDTSGFPGCPGKPEDTPVHIGVSVRFRLTTIDGLWLAGLG
jgi:hypothetical protein